MITSPSSFTGLLLIFLPPLSLEDHPPASCNQHSYSQWKTQLANVTNIWSNCCQTKWRWNKDICHLLLRWSSSVPLPWVRLMVRRLLADKITARYLSQSQTEESRQTHDRHKDTIVWSLGIWAGGGRRCVENGEDWNYFGNKVCHGNPPPSSLPSPLPSPPDEWTIGINRSQESLECPSPLAEITTRT